MNSPEIELLDNMIRLRQTARTANATFFDQHAQDYDSYRAWLDEAVAAAMAKLYQQIVEASNHSPVCEKLAAQLAEYIDWLQSRLRDLPYLAVVLRPSQQKYQAVVSSLGLVYFSLQVFDDAIHHRYWYQPEQPSMLYAASELSASDRASEALVILSGLMLCMEGFSNLVEIAACEGEQVFAKAASSLRRAVTGSIMEQSPPEAWSLPFYDRLIDLKTLEMWRAFFLILGPERHAPIFSFLERIYALDQQLRDIRDLRIDQQAALITLFSPTPGIGAARAAHTHSQNGSSPSANGHAARAASPVTIEFERSIAASLLALEQQAGELPGPECLLAQIKLGELVETALDAGLFAVTAKVEEPEPEPVTDVLHLHWYSPVQEIIESAGIHALINVNCAVCGSAERNYLFEQQGFAYHRCQECSHIYVSPRIRADLQVSISEQTDDLDSEGAYLEVQKMYAANICELLRMHAPGSRLLDIGFGRGYLMELAKAYGFEVFGVDSSRAQIDLLKPQFGNRLERVVVGRDEIPWGSFDAIMMSHILEHLPEPAETLVKIRGLMNPGAVLYIAVPDMQSTQFKVFGKKWDVINPLVHFQYFNEASLSRLLRQCGYVHLERVQNPELRSQFASRWVRLMRKLGGSDSGELAILARVPQDEAEASG